MAYRLIIFDLDGTLADSFSWFLRHLNDVADKFGFRRLPENEIEDLRNAGSREILKRLNVPMWELPLIASHMRQLKSAHAGDIALFSGTHEMLRTLRHRGATLALVSSDDETNARRQLGEVNAALFSHFACGASLFGKAAKFRRVMKSAGLDRTHAIAIGDEVRDIEAARSAGIACAAVTWGYAAADKLRALAPDLIFDQREDVARILAPRDRDAG